VDDHGLAAFLDAALEAQAAAAQRVETFDTELDLGPVRVALTACGRRVHDRLTDTLLLPTTPAPPGTPTARVVAFDSATSGVAMPAPPWTPDAYRPGLGIDGLQRGRFLASYMVEFATLGLYDRERALGVYWAHDASFTWQEAAPLRNMLRWIATDHGTHLIHAAAIGWRDDGVLILGAKGAGKSSASLAAMLDGLTFVADDFCLLHQGEHRSWRATPLTHTARVTETTLARLGGLRERITNHGAPADHKIEVTVADRLADGLTIRALTTPVHARRTEAARPVDRRTFVRSVLAGTVGVFPGLAHESLRLLVTLSEQHPCFILPIGPELAGAGDAVTELLASCTAVAR
jgi:hypothetical protein